MPGAKTKIVVVEPDPKSLRELESGLSTYYHVILVPQFDRALSVLKSERDVRAAVVATAKGVDVLGLFDVVRRDCPRILRVLLTEFEDLSQLVEGLHSGAVQRVVSKPLQHAELLGTVPITPQPGGNFEHAA